VGGAAFSDSGTFRRDHHALRRLEETFSFW
jgi:hypothetical protein